jgi:DNA-binding NarL/FixJ family response regulator
LEDSSPAERATLFAAAHALTSRESELLNHLIEGVDTHQLARLMFLLQHTVQDHLKSIFAKTSVHSGTSSEDVKVGTGSAVGDCHDVELPRV